MEKEKIIFDYEFDNSDLLCRPYNTLGTIRFSYGMPKIVDGVVEIVKYGEDSIEIKSNRFQNTLGQFVVNYLEQKYPNALIMSRADYAFSIGLSGEPINKLSRSWKRKFRRHKINCFLAKLKSKIITDKVRYIFCHKKYMKEVRDKRIDCYFNPFKYYHPTMYEIMDKDERTIIPK